MKNGMEWNEWNGMDEMDSGMDSNGMEWKGGGGGGGGEWINGME